MCEERKYLVKAGMRTNLDSMYTSLSLKEYEMLDGEYDTVEILGEDLDINGVVDLKEEVLDLLNKANFGRVTGREYGRIKEISEERDRWRYETNVLAGCPEEYLGYSFLT